MGKLPQMEQIWKAGLPRLTDGSASTPVDLCGNWFCIRNEPGLIRALGLDTPKFRRRLRQLDGDAETLWPGCSLRSGPDSVSRMKCCVGAKERISPRDLVFIADRMSLVQIRIIWNGKRVF